MPVCTIAYLGQEVYQSRGSVRQLWLVGTVGLLYVKGIRWDILVGWQMIAERTATRIQ